GAPNRVARRPGRAKLPDPDEHPPPAPQETPHPNPPHTRHTPFPPPTANRPPPPPPTTPPPPPPPTNPPHPPPAGPTPQTTCFPSAARSLRDDYRRTDNGHVRPHPGGKRSKPHRAPPNRKEGRSERRSCPHERGRTCPRGELGRRTGADPAHPRRGRRPHHQAASARSGRPRRRFLDGRPPPHR